MYEKLLDSKWKMTVFIICVIYIVFSIININRTDKPAKDRSAGTSFENTENAAGVALPLNTGTHADTIAHADTTERNFQNTQTGQDNMPAGDTPYVYKKQEPAGQRLAIEKASPGQIRSEDEIPPEIKELQTQMNNMNLSAKHPHFIKAVRVKDDNSQSAAE